LKTKREIEIIRKSGEIVKEALEVVGEIVKPGVLTGEIDKKIEEIILERGGKPSFLGYRGYPRASCISINEVVVHGIPGDRRLQDGDIVSVDIGVYKDGYHSDGARTFEVGRVSSLAKKLIDVTEKAFWNGINALRTGGRIGDVSFAIQNCVESEGFSVVRALCGHGIGTELHEEPEIPNFGKKGEGHRVKTGMALAIEPMVNSGGYEVKVLEDGWTVVTADGSLSAHYENTVVVGEEGNIVLTV